MTQIEELSQKVNDLQIALDAEQEQISELLISKEQELVDKQILIEALEAVVADLKAQLLNPEMASIKPIYEKTTLILDNLRTV